MALKGQPMPEVGTVVCKEAKTAMTTAIVGMFIFGIILGPVALAQAHKASQILTTNPQLTGWERVRAARIIGVVALVFGILNILSRVIGAHGD
jgi:hypothetical protein